MYNRLQFIRWTVTWTTSTVVLGPCYEFVVYVWFELIIGAGGSCYVWLLSFESSPTVQLTIIIIRTVPYNLARCASVAAH